MRKVVTILSTKKLRPTVIDQAAREGLEVKDMDFIEINYLSGRSLTQQMSALREFLVFTSRHAVEGFLRQRVAGVLTKKIFCLRGETEKAVRVIEDVAIVSIAGNAKALAEDILQHKEVKAVSFICGDRRRDELPDLLAKNDVGVEEVEVYKTINKGTRINDKYDGIFFFSPSGVESFFQTNILPNRIPCFCIGATTAAAVKEHTSNTVIIARETSQESIIETASQHFFKKRKLRVV